MMTEKDALKWLDENKIGNLEAKITMSHALDKRIPKEPVLIRFGVILCPECNRVVGRRVSPECFERKDNYCSHCGQAINWEV